MQLSLFQVKLLTRSFCLFDQDIFDRKDIELWYWFLVTRHFFSIVIQRVFIEATLVFMLPSCFISVLFCCFRCLFEMSFFLSAAALSGWVWSSRRRYLATSTAGKKLLNFFASLRRMASWWSLFMARRTIGLQTPRCPHVPAAFCLYSTLTLSPRVSPRVFSWSH